MSRIETNRILELSTNEIRFQYIPNKNLTTLLYMTNRTSKYVAYKIKTTAPKNYTVKPNLGYLNPSERLALEILTHSGSAQISPNDKFQILAKECDDKTTPCEEVFKGDQGKIQEQRLKVVLNKTPETIVEESLRSSNASVGNRNIEKDDIYKSTIDRSSIGNKERDEVKIAPVITSTVYKSISQNVMEKGNANKDLRTKIEENEKRIDEKEKILFKVSEERNKYKQQAGYLSNTMEQKEEKSLIKIIIALLISLAVGYYILNRN